MESRFLRIKDSVYYLLPRGPAPRYFFAYIRFSIYILSIRVYEDLRDNGKLQNKGFNFISVSEYIIEIEKATPFVGVAFLIEDSSSMNYGFRFYITRFMLNLYTYV